MSVEAENVTWRFCPFLSFEIVGWRVGRIAADLYPQLLKNSFLQPVCLLRIVTQLVEMLACFLPCSGVTDKWPLSRRFYAGLAKWRENNGAKMTSRSRKKFPVRVSETKRLEITLACFKSLTAADLSPKDDFDQLFNFQGPVISECTIVMSVVWKNGKRVNAWNSPSIVDGERVSVAKKSHASADGLATEQQVGDFAANMGGVCHQLCEFVCSCWSCIHFLLFFARVLRAHTRKLRDPPSIVDREPQERVSPRNRPHCYIGKMRWKEQRSRRVVLALWKHCIQINPLAQSTFSFNSRCLDFFSFNGRLADHA